MKNTVIFDLDGVVTDTAELHYSAWKKLADELGIEFDRKINEQLKGVSRRDSFLIIADEKTFSDEQIEEYLKIKNEYYVSSISQAVLEPLPGIIDLIDMLRTKKVRTAIGSSSCNAELILSVLNPKLEFDVIVSGKDISNSKPDPEVFIKAAQKCGSLPAKCIVIEDAAAGVLAAKQAGMTSVGVGTEKKLSEADYIVPSTIGLSQIILPQLTK